MAPRFAVFPNGGSAYVVQGEIDMDSAPVLDLVMNDAVADGGPITADGAGGPARRAGT